MNSSQAVEDKMSLPCLSVFCNLGWILKSPPFNDRQQ